MKYNYGKQFIDQEDIESVINVLKSDFLTQGPKVKEFEQAICEYTGASYCVAVANGTAALHIAVAALELKPDVSGITSPISFVASANCMLYNNIKPEFCDIDIETGLMDLENLSSVLRPNVRLVIPVHYTGRVVDVKKLREKAGNDIFIIEDAAHAIGSQYSDGSCVGNSMWSDMTIFSFHPVKTMTTGEGGCITTNNEELYKKLLELRSHGITKDTEKLNKNPGPWYYEMQSLGFNYRITDMQAALGLSQLKKLDSFVEKRRELVSHYNKLLSNQPNISLLSENYFDYTSYHLYVVLIDFEAINKSRKNVMEKLAAKDIGTQVHYIPIHQQPFYTKHFNNQIDLPRSNSFYSKCLSLPLYYSLSTKDIDYICETLKEIIKR